MVFTSSATTGSVTALKTIGISDVACLADCAAGVAIANIRSILSLTNFSAIILEC